MKKTFHLADPKVKPSRRVEAIKHDIKKYLKRERNKKLPEGFDFWDFSCSFGDTAEAKKAIHIAEIMKSIDDAAHRGVDMFYVEILATAKKRTKQNQQGNNKSVNRKPRGQDE